MLADKLLQHTFGVVYGMNYTDNSRSASAQSHFQQSKDLNKFLAVFLHKLIPEPHCMSFNQAIMLTDVVVCSIRSFPGQEFIFCRLSCQQIFELIQCFASEGDFCPQFFMRGVIFP